MEYIIQQKINELSKIYNYFESATAIKILSTMSEEEKQIVLSDPKVEDAILNIDDRDILRTIFGESPAFFQEIMFNNEKVQDILISPTKSLKRKELFQNYYKDYSFSNEDIRQLEVFLHSIKSSKIYDQIIENKFFQRIIALCNNRQLTKSFFKDLDEVKLFYNIINDTEIFKTRKSRKKAILKIFNMASDHILLSDDYDQILDNPRDFLRNKRIFLSESPKIYIDKKTLSLFSTDIMEALLIFNNIDKEFIKNFLKNDIISTLKSNNYNFSRIFATLSTSYDSFNDIDLIYFNAIINESKTNNEIKQKFIDFIFNILCNTEAFNSNETEIIKNALYQKMVHNNISKSIYKKLFNFPDTTKTVFYLKFDKISENMIYLNGITSKQIMYLNIKHINQILKLLDIENEDEISNIYAYAIKLYLVFGLERTLKILNKDYGNLNRKFFDNVSLLNVRGVTIIPEGNRYIPNIFEEFINFMFASQKDNHFTYMLANPNCELNKQWSYLYNNFNDLKEKCHNVMTLKKLNIILKQLSPTRDIGDISPDNYKLSENDILDEVCLGNKTGKPNEEIYKALREIYEKMKMRTESSIPYVKGKSSNGYSYEMMKLNDPIVFTLGYKADCCFRVKDIGHNHLLHATLCRNGRILLIYDKSNAIVAFAPLKRNGEVLIANSLECIHKKIDEKAIEAFSDAIKDIVLTTQLQETLPLNLVSIGTEAYAKPKGMPFPNDITIPTIYEKNDPIYKETDNYHKNLTIIYKNNNLDLSNIKYGNPQSSYQDPRENIKFCNFSCATNLEIENALKIINAVRYANWDLEEIENFSLCNRYGIRECIFNDDWYILTTYDGNIYGEYLNYDERAKLEYTTTLSEFQKRTSKLIRRWN